MYPSSIRQGYDKGRDIDLATGERVTDSGAPQRPVSERVAPPATMYDAYSVEGAWISRVGADDGPEAVAAVKFAVVAQPAPDEADDPAADEVMALEDALADAGEYDGAPLYLQEGRARELHALRMEIGRLRGIVDRRTNRGAGECAHGDVVEVRAHCGQRGWVRNLEVCRACGKARMTQWSTWREQAPVTDEGARMDLAGD